MPEVSYDHQAFIIGGRRVFLVSGTIHYPRVPRELWRDRLRAAKQAGLNCIETYAFWNAHEPEPGTFDFSGRLDLRRFIEMVGEEGMWCWLRPGPYVCAEWDGGGLPAWLETVSTTRKSGPMKLRENSEPFLAACARYLSAVMEQVADLQVVGEDRKGAADAAPKPFDNAPGAAAGGYRGEGGGPIMMMQAENEWFGHSDVQHDEYHAQIVRYLREGGCRVPINVCNQLWQPVDGTIHTWNASAGVPASLRQLGVVQPDAPRIVSEYWTGWFDSWGGKHADSVDAQKHLYRLAGIFGEGGMPNLFVFHGGTNFGFTGGRTVGEPDNYMTASYDYDAPLLEAGGRADKYALTKRVCTFASQFGPVLANLDPADHRVTVQPGEEDHPPAVVHTRGSQGQVVWVTRGAGDKTRTVTLQMPDGASMPVHLGKDRAAWLLLDTRLDDEVHLNFTNLRPWAWVGREMLVLYGPAGTEGVVGLNGAVHEVDVPTGKTPKVERAGRVTLVVLNEAQVDAAYLTDAGLVVGAAKLDDDGVALPLKGWSSQTRIAADGTTSSERVTVPKTPAAPKLDGWQYAGTEAFTAGTAEAFKDIKGPASLGQLGVNAGYGWYRITGVKPAAAKATNTVAPNSGDRLHVFRDGKPSAVLGNAAGAKHDPVSLSLAGDIVVLADHLGRFNFGQRSAEPVGLRSHLCAVKNVKLAKPKTDNRPAPDPFDLHGFVYFRRQGQQPLGTRLTWTVKAAGKKKMLLRASGLMADGTVVVNGTPVERVGHTTAGQLDLTLDPADENGPFKTGNNEVCVHFDTVLDDAEAKKVAGCFKLYQITEQRTDKADWAFAPWSPPAPESFGELAERAADLPSWFRAAFTVKATDCPLFFDASSLSKGQLYLNGHNLARYFCQTASRKKVPPQKLYYLPEPWLNVDGNNELLAFDEHGFDPSKTKLAYRALGPFH